MTREEAIKDIQENIKPFVGGKSLDMAIEALSQPIVCKDYCIDDDNIYCSPKVAERVVEALSAARNGHWIYGEHEVAMCDGYRCDQCGFFITWDYNHTSPYFIEEYHFCPNCGSRMAREGGEA